MSVPPSRLIFGLIPWYGALIVLGAFLAILMADREATRIRLPKDTAIDLALRVLPIGILGARIYYVLFSWKDFQSRPLSVFAIWEGGLAIYGGLIAGIGTVLVFCRRRKLSMLQMLDILAPGVALAQSIGRWGNYFNQEAYGIPVSAPSLQFFPFAVQISEGGGLTWHAATFFYESIGNLIICLLLLFGRRRLFRRRGDVFGAYCLLYAALRLWVENLRMDSLYLGGGIRVSQLFSILLCLTMLLTLTIRKGKSGREVNSPVLFTAILPLIPGLLCLFFCLGWTPSFLLSVPNQMLLLCGFSLLTVLAALILYGRSVPSEVCYAHHESQKPDLPAGPAL